jgi:hypothetical protein
VSIQVTMTEWDALLQEDYVQREIVDQINKKTIFKGKLQRKGLVDGRRRVYPVMLGAHQGVGAAAENATLPPYGAGVYKDVLVTAKYNYGSFYVTGQALAFSDRKSFVEFGMRILRDTKEGLTLDLGRQCWGDGSGTLALVNNGSNHAVGDTTITVDSAYGVAWGSLAANETMLFRKNMKVQFATDTNNGVGYTVTGITATTIVISPALVATAANNARIYRLGSKDNEVEGFLKIVGTSSFMTSVMGLANDTYHGIDRSEFPDWEGNVTDASAALSLANIRGIKDKMFKRDEEPELCIMSTEVARDFEDLLDGNQRFIPATKLEGGYTSLAHDGLTFTKDKDAPVKALSLCRPSRIAWAQASDPQWIKDHNGIMRVVPNADAMEGRLKWYSNLDCDAPKSAAILFNLTVT